LRIIGPEFGNRVEPGLESLEMMSWTAHAGQSLDARAVDDLTDPTQPYAEIDLQSCEFEAPASRPSREEQLVVLAALEHQLRRVEAEIGTIANEAAGHRKTSQVDLGAQPRLCQEMGEVRRQAIGEVDTSRRGFRARETLAGGEARYGDSSKWCSEPVGAVAGERGRAEDSGDEEFVTGPHATATQSSASRHAPHDRHVETAMFRSCEISPDQRARISTAFGNEAIDECVEDVETQIGWCREAEQTPDGRRAHRREIRQIHRQRSTADGPGRFSTKAKMNVLDLRICGEHQIGSGTWTQDRRIIPDAEGPVSARRPTRAASDARDEC
jgi:hypothetical protein